MAAAVGGEECVVCSRCPDPTDPHTPVLQTLTQHTATPLRDLISPPLHHQLTPTHFICLDCLSVLNEKDRLQMVAADVADQVQAEIKSCDGLGGTISIIIGESEGIEEKVEKQYKMIQVDNIDLNVNKENNDSSTTTPKKRRGRPPKARKKSNVDSEQLWPPPLMVTQREKRKRSTKFNTFLEVLKGEKEFYIEDEGVEEPQLKKRGRGRRKRLSSLGTVEIDDLAEEDKLEKMCIIQVTDKDMNEKLEASADKDQLFDEVVQEIFGINVDGENSLMNEIKTLDTARDLINVIDEINAQDTEENVANSPKKITIEPEATNLLKGIKVECLEEADGECSAGPDWPKTTPVANSKYVNGINSPSIEVTEIKEELAVSMPSLEVTLTHTEEDNNLHAVINDPNALSAAPALTIKEECGTTSEASSDRFRCKLCSETFSSKDLARKHAQECHKDTLLTERGMSEDSFKCAECDRTFPTEKGRDRHHLHSHLKHKPVECPVCHVPFNSFRPLERHLRNFHDMNATLYCEVCEVEFVLGTSLEHHKEIVHPVSNKAKTVSIRDPSAFRTREPTKHNRMYECPFCKVEIFGSRALRLHHMKMHNGQGYTCKYCKYRSACLSTMNRHMVKVHKVRGMKLYLYSCQKCGAGYQDPRDLEEHYTVVHNAATAFLCQHCGEKFACMDMLRFHRSSHRAFSCKLCNLGFMKEEALEEHVKAVHASDPVGKTSNVDGSNQSENENPQDDLEEGSSCDSLRINEHEDTSAVNSKVFEIGSDGTVKINEEAKESSKPVCPSDDVTLHLQQTVEGGLEEMDVLNPLKGQKVKDLPKKMNCPVCNKVLTTKFLRTHMLSHKGELPHKCHVCLKAYAQGTLLRKHMKNRHYEEFLKLGNKNPKKHKVSCDFCKNVFDDIFALEVHLWEHMDEKMFECTDCKIKFGMESNLQEHYKSHYFKEAKPCPVCKREFKSIGFYNQHVEKCKNRWECEQCGVECETQEYYRKHQRAQHGGDNVVRYQCNMCEKSFVDRHRYEDHMITHSSVKAYTCHICKKQFKRQRPLNDHMARAHTPRNRDTVCSMCHRSFQSQQELAAHKKCHRKDFHCQACGQVYTNGKTLGNHLAVHHSDSTYTCNLCDQTFTKQINLKIHYVKHGHLTTVICQADGCLKKFKTEAFLRNHSARRHGELQYDCLICEDKYYLESDQIRHMTTHLSDTSLTCEECGRHYRTENMLERHYLTHHSTTKPFECGMCQLTMSTHHQALQHIQTDHGLSDGTLQIIVKRWQCSSCKKLFVARGTMRRHLQSHAKTGVSAESVQVRTSSSPTSTFELSGLSGILDAAGDTANFLDQISLLDWQDLTPLLQFYVINDNNDRGEKILPADIWQCPGCLLSTYNEPDMRDHLISSAECQEAVIWLLAGGLTSTESIPEDMNVEERLMEEGSGTVLQLTGSDGGTQYVIVKEETASQQRPAEDKGSAVEQGERDMQVLVSVDDMHHLLQQPAPPNIQIVVEDSAPLKQLFADGEMAREQPAADSIAQNSREEDSVISEVPLLNVSEVLLQTADGQLVLQQTVGGVTQYQLVEGVGTPGEEEALENVLPDQSSTLHDQFIVTD